MIGQEYIDGFCWMERANGRWIFYPVVLSQSRPSTIFITRRYPNQDYGSEAPVLLGLLDYGTTTTAQISRDGLIVCMIKKFLGMGWRKEIPKCAPRGLIYRLIDFTFSCMNTSTFNVGFMLKDR